MTPPRSRDPEAELLWYEEATHSRCEALGQLGVGGEDGFEARSEIRHEQQYLQDRERRLQRLREIMHGGCEEGTSAYGSRIELSSSLCQTFTKIDERPVVGLGVPPPA